MPKRAAPKPLRQASELARLLLSLEVCSCDCPMSKLCLAGKDDYPEKCPGKDACKSCPPALDLENPCPHVEAADHDYSLEEWLVLMRMHDAKGYAEPNPPLPRITLSKETRIKLYQLRAKRREALHSSRDVHHDEVAEVGVQAVKGKREANSSHGSNGRLV